MVYLAFVGLCIDGGNYTEEYCIFFTLLGLATCVDYTVRQRAERALAPRGCCWAFPSR